MPSPYIKICGIRSAQMALASIQAGAAFVGVICHPDSKRYVDLATAIEIAAATRAQEGHPVAVFVNHSAKQMLAFCQATGIEIVQLHGDQARAEQHLLPEHYQRIYVCPVADSGPQPEAMQRLMACDSQRDYLLFDYIAAGSGQRFAWDTVAYQGEFAMGIAGGLRIDNVKQAVQRFQPRLVDVSSGVEDHSGEKNLNLIREFVTAAKEPACHLEELATRDLRIRHKAMLKRSFKRLRRFQDDERGSLR